MSLRKIVDGLAAQAPKKGKSHPWWAVGVALQTLMDSTDPNDMRVVAQLEEEFDRRTDDEA